MKRAGITLRILAAVTIVLTMVLAAWNFNHGSGSNEANNRAVATTETTGVRSGDASSIETDETDDPAHGFSAPVTLQLDPVADDLGSTNADRSSPADSATGELAEALYNKMSLLTEAQRAEAATANPTTRTLSDANEALFNVNRDDKEGENAFSEEHR